jgi:hypothetical protein
MTAHTIGDNDQRANNGDTTSTERETVRMSKATKPPAPPTSGRSLRLPDPIWDALSYLTTVHSRTTAQEVTVALRFYIDAMAKAGELPQEMADAAAPLPTAQPRPAPRKRPAR